MSVEVQNLTRRFTSGGTPAVRGVSFVAPGGAITSLLGPSGAGKSTLLRTIAGLESPDEGRVLIEGKDCSNIRIQERGVGLVFQGYALFEHMTVRENLAFGLDVRGHPKAQTKARVDELLELIQLRELGARKPSQLSGGQRQRVAFARALAPRPRVLLLDEPFGALDTQVRMELREWLVRLHEKTQLTTVLVTHDQEEAFEVSDHVVVLFGGQVAQVGTPDETYDRPVNRQVAEFIGGANVLASGTVVRPHDVQLKKSSESPSKITALRRVGGYVKLTVQLASGERINAEMSQTEAIAQALSEGDRVEVLFPAPSANEFIT
ncbi:MAG: ATP-binding cassette domain-containing protein [Archangium sp.]|nr:ATP-binding cassette domain-containing protein [Archangium sp.]MDP3572147.1 ATP-binding cassette domain-containing protein [Archangium sp.]